MSNSRKVQVLGNVIYQGDNGVDAWTFELDRYYGNNDLSLQNAYLKIVFADETNDKILLTKTVLDSKIQLLWNVLENQTLSSGEAVAQICFENVDLTSIFNSEKFKIEIRESIVNTLSQTNSITAFRQQQTIINEKYIYIKNVIDAGIVTKINGKVGNVTLTAEDLASARKTYVDAELQKIVNGTTTVAKSTEAVSSQKATSDSSGLNIATNYLKKSEQRNTEYQSIYSNTMSVDVEGGLTVNLGGQFKKLFVKLFVPSAIQSRPTFSPVLRMIDGETKKVLSQSSTNYASSTLMESYFTFEIECVCNNVKTLRTYSNSFSGEITATDNKIGIIPSVTSDKKYIEKLKISFAETGSSTEIIRDGVSVQIWGIRYNA